MPVAFAFLDTSTFVFAYGSSFLQPRGIALARLNFNTNKIKLIQRLVLEAAVRINSASKRYVY